MCWRCLPGALPCRAGTVCILPLTTADRNQSAGTLFYIHWKNWYRNIFWIGFSGKAEGILTACRSPEISMSCYLQPFYSLQWLLTDEFSRYSSEQGWATDSLGESHLWTMHRWIFWLKSFRCCLGFFNFVLVFHFFVLFWVFCQKGRELLNCTVHQHSCEIEHPEYTLLSFKSKNL